MKSISEEIRRILAEPADHVLVREKLCSLRSAGTFLKNNQLSVNGISVKERNFPVDSDRDVFVLNGVQFVPEKHLYLIMNKPEGYVCSRTSDSHKTVYSLFSDEIKNHPLFNQLHSAGRLDSETSGLLIFTTNGRLSNYITAPETHLSKTYEAELRFPVKESEKKTLIELFRKGLEVPAEKKSDAFFSKPAELEFLAETKCRLTITEGKFHQVRRMFLAVNNEVTALKRVSIGDIGLSDQLEKGRIREFNPCNL